MKKMLFPLLFLCIATGLKAQANMVEVGFDYAKQSGVGSNQFAIWIEDAQGHHVKTLYATRFTANGGWRRRAQSLPAWVKQSNLAEMDAAQIDAITGPTPGSGRLRYSWDGTDSAGHALPYGEYRVMLEATLRMGNRVLYAAAITLGGGGQAAAQPQYFGSGRKERGMIGNVTVTY
ncbi:MAG: DUF2271 domain-containing protein [Treponema sp.]|jgi:hypothetical protein|nr:DUF2271 domain-containing protein [Treponema sp.]